ncbi:MAG: hypothetical protein A3F95_03045 [Candidatus Nealsonbacteria bacterium RIFCSPLOWO2_12_FULL_39_31]|uniref:DUF1648 domain-containing protein n=3 Tax=Candidatus Nealsoniibacteriota TaxID=1817911 RepID=A0A1G2EK95_9BACT|nr:MAG: hypothetical protein US88_C0004G0009 [Parcubacteria group bacterium GW2011_GWA2_38_27]KKQ97313.1 MAG: hypothetical protein UT22_C0013G0009 [Parcubacteria group bacterium GW2011_GWC2_39_11]OGZ19428.1 MAG: hypothetical protein A2626_02400 [Candidatus Nealsonbacteria bacterium RIFCSPHIGHO2_01_FULL_38_55]OGZ21699.1 MAG: hypothetical protein A3C48_02820 [Candidatus Nealsonbacteria bacterium RIFCSPHIGHO2_02_FULL_38_75]OGZ22406.1 MAG: hypothetical protein A3E18_00510 [Candidatus Nealsonbacteri
MKKPYIFCLVIILFSFALAVFYYPAMPEKMASHWNANGEVNDYMPKFWGLFLMPLVSLIIFGLLVLIPKIDPLKENFAKFRKYFDWFIVLLEIFLLYIYILTLIWNAGIRFDFTPAIIPAIAALFYYVGILTEKSERNWFVGIRNPWTLSSEAVWKKTHNLGGKLFRIAGLIAFLGILFPKYSFLIFILLVIFFAIFINFYSYFEYKKEK